MRWCLDPMSFALLGALLFSPAIGSAQVTASISGIVQDPAGMPVGGAAVTVKSLETGATRVVTTDEEGKFRALSLPVGQQEVRAEKTGFKAAVRTGIDLVVGQEAVVTLRLEVGEVVQQVTVVAEAPMVNTTTASVAGLVGEQQVKDLPLNGRSFDNLITLNPGTINYTSMKSANTTTSNGNNFSVNGRRPADNLFLWNGIEYTGASQLADTPGGVSGDLLGIDAIREFNVLTDTYGAEYGKRSGAQVIVITQSGTNALHGTLFEFLRNSALDNPGIFDQGTVPPFRRNQFGASLGGPLKKDKLFLFGNYEGYRQSLAVSSVSVVPDDQARLGLLPNASGMYVPVAKLNSAMLPFTALWPKPNGPELLVNSLPSGSALAYYNPLNHIQEDFGTLRADANLRAQDRLSVSYMNDTGNSIIPLADPLFASGLRLGAQVASVEETHVVSPSILNTFRAGFSRGAFNYDAASYAPFPAGLAFVQGGQPGAITINSGITAAGGNVNAGVWDRRNLFTYTDNVQIVKGIHQISAGVWFQRVQENEDTASRRLGMATFSTLTTFLQGTLVNFQVVPDHNALGWRSLFGAWYIEDAIKLRPNLTFQAGLRQEFTTGWNEDSGRASNYITGPNGVLLTTPLLGSSVYTANNATHLFSPRVGLAWDPWGNQKTAVRAGFGTYYSLIDVLTFLINSLPPYNGSAAFTGSLPSLLPITPNVPVPPSCGPGVTASNCTTFAPQGVQQNAKTPTVEEWNLSVEQQLSRNTALRVAYVGSHGYHGMLSVDPNTIPAQICPNPSGCLAGGTAYTLANCPTPAACTVPQGVRYIPGGPAFATSNVNLRPNPYLSAGFFWFTEANSSYNALQVDLTRRLAKGLQFRGNFTWSKNLDMNSAPTIAQAQNQPQMILNRNDLPLDWGPSALNITSQSSISVTYDLPFGKGVQGLAGKLVSGWQANGITTLMTGFPFTPLIGANRSGDGNTRNPDRPYRNPSFTGPIILGTQTQWFNPNAFLLPAPGTFGDLGRGVYRGPGLAEVDMSIFKNTTLTERIHAQFRAEFFNLLNRTNLGTPNSTVFSGTSANPSAGLITTLATTPRQIQFGMKLIF
ncbi:MAG TPA: carboxypeptidase regulatory-like domain-containing protein [Bryobacteraceae bacterium]|nr:carboxypeptidase regulatory-like domain-containing protein [Bryobacteraceae bacterium]